MTEKINGKEKIAELIDQYNGQVGEGGTTTGKPTETTPTTPENKVENEDKIDNKGEFTKSGGSFVTEEEL